MAWPSLWAYQRILDARFREAFLAQQAGVALSAGAALPIRIIAAMREPEVHAELSGKAHDIGFAERHQRGVTLDMRAAVEAGVGRQIRHAFVSLDELGAAIRVAGVIQRVHADENIGSFEHLRPS